MILLRSIDDIASIKTVRNIVHGVVFTVTLLSIERRTLKGKMLFDAVMVSQCGKHGGVRGRICEVGPPASVLSFFTGPYSHFVLNGHPALRGRRLPPSKKW